MEKLNKMPKKHFKVQLEQLQPSPDRVGQSCSKKDVTRLSKSIKRYGLLQPIIITPNGTEDQFYIADGVKRWKAVKKLGKKTIRVVLDKENNPKVLQLIANLFRKGINPLEKAEAFKTLIKEGMKRKEITKRFGVSKSSLSQYEKIADMSTQVKKFVSKNLPKLGVSILRKLSTLSLEIQMDLVRDIVGGKIIKTLDSVNAGYQRRCKKWDKADSPVKKETPTILAKILRILESLLSAWGEGGNLSVSNIEEVKQILDKFTMVVVGQLESRNLETQENKKRRTLKGKPYPELKLVAWHQRSKAEQRAWIDKTFKTIRKWGFPYVEMDIDEKKESFKNQYQADTSNIFQEIEGEGTFIKQSMTGISLAWSYHPHASSVKCGSNKSPKEVFESDKLLKEAIEKTFLLKKDFHFTNFQQTLKIFTGTQTVSNFRPSVANAIYDKYAGDGVVWDMSCGYGGRLLGFMTSKRGKVYYGTDPCTATYKGLLKMIGEYHEYYKGSITHERSLTQFQDGLSPIPLDKKEIKIAKLGSEDFKPSVKIDLAFTSPPYFSTEKYSDETTQSYKKFSTYKKWLEDFMGTTLDNAINALKADGWILLNVANTKKAKTLEKDVVELAKRKGLVLKETLHMVLSTMPGQKQKDILKTEPIFCFQKKKSLQR